MSTPLSTTKAAEEEKELGLVSKVELRIALADSDSKLEGLLKTYLAPLLLKLASEHGRVRAKVLSITKHINTRIKSPMLQLPVAALLKQFKDEGSSPLVRQVDLIYIHQGIGRLPAPQRIDLFPILIRGISQDVARSPLQGASIFNLLLRLLPYIQIPERGSKEDGAFSEKLGLDDRLDVEFMAPWLGKTLLLTIDRRAISAPTPMARITSPGLSPEDYEFLTIGKTTTWDPNDDSGMNLANTKITTCKFLASGAFKDKDRFIPALIASADTNSNISNIGEELVKRSIPSVSLEDSTLIAALLKLYFGDSGASIPPVRPSLKIKLAILFSKSITATTFTAEVSRLIEEGLVPSETHEGNQHQSTVLLGREGSKLRGAIIAFTNWVARMASPEDLQVTAPKIVNRLRDFITLQGWPNPNEDISAADSSLRGSAYECIGLLAKTRPEELLLGSNLDLLRWLLTSLSADSTENVSVSIEEALGSILQALAHPIQHSIQYSLRPLLLTHMKLEIGNDSLAADGSKVRRSTRFTAVRFANRCLLYGDVAARWIDLLAIGRSDERNEVIEEGRKGLDPNWYRMINPSDEGPLLGVNSRNPTYELPDFSQLVDYLFLRENEDGQTYLGEQSVQLPSYEIQPAAFPAAVSYSRRILLNQLLKDTTSSIEIDIDWERKIDAVATAEENARRLIGERLRSLPSQDRAFEAALHVYLRACFQGMLEDKGGALNECGKYVVELCALADDHLIAPMAKQACHLKDLILSNSLQSRSTASQAFGILGSHEGCPSGELDAAVHTFLVKSRAWKEAVGAEVHKCHGSILALAFIITRLHCRNRLQVISVRHQDFIELVLDVLENSRDSLLQEAAVLAVDQMSLFSVISLSQISSPHTLKSVTGTLLKKANAGNERAIMALGHLAMICPEHISESLSLWEEFLEPIFKLHELKQPEIHLAIGEALSCVAFGWQSKSLMAALDVNAKVPETAARTTTLQDTLEKILKYCKQSKPSLRKASCMWLLCQVQYCGHSEVVQQRLRWCQAAFKGFLSDRDVLVQESASRGLTLVYEKGDKDLKDALVRDLISSFTNTSANLAGNVSEETELFEPGSLPTGDGSVSTYKDIMSLASELGDPSLVYRFMSLASNNAIWSSRAAFGRFGLGNVLSESGYLAENPKLYPKLYRYRFDPNSNVQKSMNDIWTSLVKDSSATIDKYFSDIMEDLLKSILGKEWRVRQACCAAIADLIQGRPLEKYEGYLSEIWTLAFKVLDDIKDSVRSSAMSLCRVLTGMLVRSAEAGSSRKADTMLENVMPFLMSPSGLEASAQEVQMFALDTILKLAKTGTKTLKSYVPSLVERLLGLLSTLEPEAVNYLHLNASKYDLTEEKIDAARLQSVRSSPMMDAIERCLDILDEDTIRELVPCLENAMRQAVGMPSKVGCSRVLVSLSTRHNFLFRPHADQFLKIVQRTILDRNETVSSSYAMAAGYIGRLVSDQQILQCCGFARKLYFESEDERHRVIAGDLIRATSKYHVQESFQDTWNDNVGGSRAILLYQNEILKLALTHLDSPRWVVKHASALSIAGVAHAGVKQLSLQQQELLWPALERAVGGKSWEGKEKVLEAFVEFAKESTKLQLSNPQVGKEMKKARTSPLIYRAFFFSPTSWPVMRHLSLWYWCEETVPWQVLLALADPSRPFLFYSLLTCRLTEQVILRESKRNNPGYRQHALLYLGQFVESCPDDMSQDVWDIVAPLVEEYLSSDAEMDVDSGSGGASSKTTQILTVANGILSSSKAIKSSTIPTDAEDWGSKEVDRIPYVLTEITITDLTQRISDSIKLTEKTKASPARRLQSARYDALRQFSRVLQQRIGDTNNAAMLMEGNNVLGQLVIGIIPLDSESVPSEQRMKRAEAAFELAKLCKGAKGNSKLEPVGLLQHHIAVGRQSEPDRAVQTLLDNAHELLSSAVVEESGS
ncbi:MAG: proteasome component M29 [Sclerophora amabilis]|nr:MAG: proteasome component M29 [Sclerophora amabilis]